MPFNFFAKMSGHYQKVKFPSSMCDHNCARFEECHQKGVGGINETK
jgi:hypothetical protein